MPKPIIILQTPVYISDRTARDKKKLDKAIELQKTKDAIRAKILANWEMKAEKRRQKLNNKSI